MLLRLKFEQNLASNKAYLANPRINYFSNGDHLGWSSNEVKIKQILASNKAVLAHLRILLFKQSYWLGWRSN